MYPNMQMLYQMSEQVVQERQEQARKDRLVRQAVKASRELRRVVRQATSPAVRSARPA